LIQTEYNIRYILNDGSSAVRRADGSTVSSPTLLPSAFICLETEHDGEYLASYRIYGGGYGHGIGMSQNGAKNMAESGFTYEEILKTYYKESEVEKLK